MKQIVSYSEIYWKLSVSLLHSAVIYRSDIIPVWTQ